MYQNNNILVVDDDPTQLVLLSGYFTGLGCKHIFEASSAQDALSIVQNNKDQISLIVSDLMMPDMDGIEMMRSLKDEAFSGSIALVSSLDWSVINSARKLGELHELKVIGACRKPLKKIELDAVFKGESFDIRQNVLVEREDDSDLNVTSALRDEQFVPFYQPKIDMITGRIVGVEALARWLHPELGLLSPSAFLPAIEKNNLTKPFTLLMFKQAFADLRNWGRAGLRLKVALNIKASDISDTSFPNEVQKLLSEYGIESSQIVIEITEDEILAFNSTSMEVLTRLRMMGIDIAIDDFGTGFSNLQCLRQFPYTELKIDQSFVRGVTKDRFSQETVRVAATLGQQLNMRVLAEGVETIEELDFIKIRGIDEAQGFYIAKPMSAAALSAYYSEIGPVVSLKNPSQAA